MSRRQGKRIGPSQQAVLKVLSTFGLTAETDVRHWAKVESVASMANLSPAGTRGALLGLYRACLVERRAAPAQPGRPTRAHVYALAPAGQKEATRVASDADKSINLPRGETVVQEA